MATPIDVLSTSLPALIDHPPGSPALGPASRAADTIRAWQTPQWREALLGLPLDERTYADRFEITRQADIERLWRWWCAGTPAPASPETVGYLGFYLLTVVAMHCSDRMRFHGDRPEEVEVAGATSDLLCRTLVADPRVQAAIAALYDPLPATDDLTLTEWRTIDVGSLAFHRQGTTSLILAGHVTRPSRGRAAQFALKLVIYPYLTVPAITSATRDYLTDHSSPTGGYSPAVTVWASHDSWILMDFVPGRTLAECLAERLTERAAERPSPAREIARPVDVQQLEVLGDALLRGLAELEAEGRRHGDLSPSNIIVQRDGGSRAARVRFVDLGVNHLHTQSLAGSVQGEAAYVAPEVRSTGVGGDRADLYSLGVLLVAIGGIAPSAPGTVPDQFYVASAGMARLLEDLVDADPARRLLVSRIDHGSNRVEQVGTLFRDEVEVLRENEPDDDGWLQAVHRYAPGAGTVSRQRRIWRVRSMQARRGGSAAGTAHPPLDRLQRAHLHRARRLRLWAVLCAVGLWSTTALVLTWWARDLGLDWQARWFDLLNQVSGRSGSGLVFFDDVREYPIPDPAGNLPSRLVALTTALVSARVYLGILADLSPSSGLPRRGMLRVRTVVAAVGMRSPVVVPALCVLLPTLVQRDWWPLATQVFVLWIYLVVSASLWFARDANRRARAAGLSTVPPGEIHPLARLEAWQPTMLIYTVVVLLFGTLIQLGLLQDELAYASFASVVNIAIWYFKCGVTDAPYVRAGLSRAILAAERLDHLNGRRDTPEA